MTPAEECPVGLESLSSEPGAWRCPECLEIRREGEHYADRCRRDGLSKQCLYCRDRKAYWAKIRSRENQRERRAATSVPRNLKHWAKRALLEGKDPLAIVLEAVREEADPK
jgi:hypothetical protein